jgi:hypothetical protein
MSGIVSSRSGAWHRTRPAVLKERATHALMLLACAAACGCADFDAPAPVALPDVAVTDPSFSADVQPIFTARCATASCHTLATHQMGLDLQAGFAYDAIVGQPSRQRLGMLLVEPGHPENSRVVQVISPGAEPRMPLGRTPLTANQIATIQNWIAHGAPRN